MCRVASTGSSDRGRVAEGWYADLVVLDPSTVGSGDVAMRFDLPGGAGRLYAEADGIDHVLVNGRRIVVDGQLTDERSGKLLRSGRDTETSLARLIDWSDAAPLGPFTCRIPLAVFPFPKPWDAPRNQQGADQAGQAS